ncbi:NADH:ubiquinone oxidoreductase [Candidatus Bipolaricaulota bacterium]|nr:NADH:ubiquinone oxidoreductase [Candidatus Bipolaricaulota bacterium]MBS3825760.1 NADH:ubiquinone oxidoreductase [Candidatus Bipolaricaulota bacterium]
MKPRVAFFDFAGCEGDQLQVANLEEKVIDLVEIVNLVNFREIMTEKSDDYDVAFIEGSIATDHDAERLKEIRSNAAILVALGSCAAIGGINSIRNSQNPERVEDRVYGDDADKVEAWDKAKPADAIVDVDHYVYGCPINKDEFIHVVESLVQGKEPSIPTYPVCVECKMNENVCVFARGGEEKSLPSAKREVQTPGPFAVDQGPFCLGPVTRAGCDSICVNEGTTCWGCRGLIDNPNQNAHKKVLDKYGLTVEEVINKFNLYFGWQQEERNNE